MYIKSEACVKTGTELAESFPINLRIFFNDLPS